MDMKPDHKLELDFSEWTFNFGDLDELVAKGCAEAVQSSLEQDPPYLSFRCDGGALRLSLMLCCLSDVTVWRCQLEELVLDHLDNGDGEQKREIAEALRRLADVVDAF